MCILLKQNRFCVLLMGLFLLSSLGACKLKRDDQNNSLNQEKGSLSFKVQWENPDLNQFTPVLDCEKNFVNHIEVKVMDTENNIVAKGGPWLCYQHKGEILDIDPGTVRVLLIAKDSASRIVFSGESENVIIQKGKSGVAEIQASLCIPRIDTSTQHMTLAKPELSWSAVKGFSQYSFHLSKDENMENAQVTDFGSNHLFHSPFNLEERTTYYWQVFAKDAYGNISRGSDVGTFTTLGTPKVIQPTDNAGLLSCKTDFQWDDVESSNGYVIEISEFFDMKDPFIREDVEESRFRAIGLIENKRYYWWVYAKDSKGNLGKPSSKRDFTAEKTITLSRINPGTSGSHPREMMEVGDYLFFNGADDEHGNELWVMTEKEKNVRLVKDINSGRESSDPDDFTIIDGKLLFTAFNRACGRELWISDGTELGTVMVKDIMKGGGSSSPDFLAASQNPEKVNSLVFFSAENKKNGRELWQTDGSSGGTRLIANIFPDAENISEEENEDISKGSNPQYLTFLNGVLFFSARNKKNGVELWKYHEGRAEMVLDIYPNGESDKTVNSSHPKNLTSVGNTLYFSARDRKHGNELWKCDVSDPLNLDISLVKDIFPGKKESNPFNMTSLFGELYFSADDGEYGRELWKSDGALENTVMVCDVNQGKSHSNPSHMLEFAGQIFFRAENDVFGSEIWSSDGSKGNANLLTDLRRGADGSDPEIFEEVDGLLLFSADDGNYGKELWVSDGTGNGTVLLMDIWKGSKSSNPSHINFFSDGNMFAFQANDGFYGEELWVSDGSFEKTFMVYDINEKRSENTYHQISVAKDQLFFTSMDKDTGVELWRSDGSLEGTLCVKDIHPNGSSFPQSFRSFGDYLYFFADNGSISLWRSGGTKESTVPIHPLMNAKNEWPRSLVNTEDRLFFVAKDEIHGTELWTSEGSAETTHVIDIVPGKESSFPQYLLPMAGSVYFAATGESSGVELWKSDGTLKGTSIVKDIHPEGDSFPRDLVGMKDQLILFIARSDRGDGLFRTDAQSGLTEQIKILDSSRDLNVIESALYFICEKNNMVSLWKSDGTEDETKEIFLFNPLDTMFFGPKTRFNVGNFRKVNNTIFFVARIMDGRQSDGQENVRCDLWKTSLDGKRTVKVISQLDKDGSMFSESMVVFNNELLLKAYEPMTGYKLWKSDGTKKGTKIINDFDRFQIFTPRQLTLLDGALFFHGFDEENGDQLRVYCP